MQGERSSSAPPSSPSSDRGHDGSRVRRKGCLKLGHDRPIGKPRRMIRERRKKRGPEAEEVAGSKPSEIGEDRVEVTRSELKDSLLTQTPQIQRQVEQDESDIEAKLNAQLLEVSLLLKQNTLEAHKEAYRLLDKYELLASHQYQKIHTKPDNKERKNFSEVSPKRVNSFARTVLKRVELKDKSVVLELGSGYSNDTLYFARNSKAEVFGVDKVEAGINAAEDHLDIVGKESELEWVEGSLKAIADKYGQSYADTKKFLDTLASDDKCTVTTIWREMEIGSEEYRREIAQIVEQMNTVRDRIGYDNDDYLKVLKSGGGMGVDLIYSHSTLHYFPPLVLKEQIFPMIADALKDREGNVKGKFCLAMKIAKGSASAQSKNQIKLVEGDPYNPSYDKVDKLFRIYPESTRELIALVEQHFDIEYLSVEPISGYDKTGDTEQMCHLILVPREVPIS